MSHFHIHLSAAQRDPALAAVRPLYRPRLIGMGESDKLSNSGAGPYRFVEHRRYLDVLLEGSGRPALQGLRSEADEKMVLRENFFIGKILPGAILRTLSAEEMTEGRLKVALLKEDAMSVPPVYSSDVAFTPAVKAVQARRGSRASYHRMEERGSWPDYMTADLQRFVAAQQSIFLATASADGQPYIQHRGGPPGFLKVLNDKTIGFADYAGNRQYITVGNLSENPKAQLFLMDYGSRQRVKIWGEARVVEDADVIAMLMPQAYKARAERAIIFDVAAWDVNCSQHIPQLFEAAAFLECAKHVAALEEEIARLRMQLQQTT